MGKGLSPPGGETEVYKTADLMGRGLSPPVRGNHRACSSLDIDQWSIPARAGKPVDLCR